MGLVTRRKRASVNRAYSAHMTEGEKASRRIIAERVDAQLLSLLGPCRYSSSPRRTSLISRTGVIHISRFLRMFRK